MKRSLSFLLVLAACGDNKVLPDAPVTPRVDAADPDAYHARPRAVAVAGDFGSPGVGIVTRLDLANLDIVQNLAPGAALGDPVVRYFDGKLYIVNRFGSNNVTILNAATFALEEQISTGEGSNPQDVAVVGNKLYLPAMGTSGVVVLTRGSTAIETIDLATPLGESDGEPDCMSAYAVGTKLFVACGLLDNFVATGPGKVAVIDTTNDSFVTSVTLNYANPQGFFVRSPQDSVFFGDLLIPTTPSFTSYATGCLERISVGETPTAGCAITNAELGGFQTGLAVAHNGMLLWLAVGTLDSSFANPTGKLMGFDLEDGTLWTAPISPSSQLIVDVATCPGGAVVVTDRTMNAAGLRIYESSVERTTVQIGIGRPPGFGNNLVCYEP
jgi:hypothetical protein